MKPRGRDDYAWLLCAPLLLALCSSPPSHGVAITRLAAGGRFPLLLRHLNLAPPLLTPCVPGELVRQFGMVEGKHMRQHLCLALPLLVFKRAPGGREGAQT